MITWPAQHDGYERLAEPATHTRSILFLKNDYWIMRDLVNSNGNHNLDLHFQFASDATVKVKPDHEGDCQVHASIEDGSGASLRLVSFGRSGRWRREEAQVSQSYGERRAAPGCVFSTQFSGDERNSDEVITVLLPTTAQQPVFQVREVEAIGGRAFEITHGEHCDLIMLRDQQAAHIETVRMVSDFNWTWARFSQGVEQSNELHELLVLDGQHLKLDGCEVLKSETAVNYLVAARVGDRFRVETSEGRLDLSFPIEDLTKLFAEPNPELAISKRK